MTALLAGSLALITLAAGTLVFGWLSTNEALIWSSLVMSVAAGILAATAEIRSRRLPTRRSSAAATEPAAESADSSS